MNYQTYAPSKALDTFVKCYWTLDGDSDDGPKRQTIVPDGSMEMIFHYGDLYKQYLDDDTSIIQPRCFVIGQLTRPLEIEPTGATGIFSVRFHPEGFLPFATIPIKEMENKAVSLNQLFGEKGEQIEQKILCSTTITDKITFIEEFLLSHLADAKTINHIIRSTIETIFTSNGQLSVHNLSDRIQINRRQLERQFSETVGLSPKKLSKIIRLQSALKMLLNKDFTSLTGLAYEGKYYDQAHFIKDFKEFTGRTPKEFYGDDLKMSELFYTKK